MDNDTLLKQLTTLFEKQKRLAESAAHRKGQKTVKYASRAELEHQFTPFAAISAPTVGMVRQTVIGYAYPPCTTPLSDLKAIKIEELELETVHRGRVLLVRTFGHPVRVQAVQNGIEDGTGAVERVALYNSDIAFAQNNILPKYALLAIKEPYYKVTADGGHTIRVDHPSDLVRLHPIDDLVPLELRPRLLELDVSPQQWKAKGNAAFKARDFSYAVELYSRGLMALSQEVECKGQVRGELHRNRAQANIHLERYEAALADAEASIMPPDMSLEDQASLIKSNVKAYYRAGTAAYQMEDYDKARKSFKAILTIAPSDSDGERELRRTEQRIVERDTGVYDFTAMTNYATTVAKRLDNASFTANVQMQDSIGRGRGLFSTKDINAGELIVCEKALYVAFNTDQGGEQSVIMNMNTTIMSVGTHPSRLVGVVRKMLHSTTLARRFMDLYDGGYQPRGVHVVEGNIVAVDTFQVEAALDFNGFGCPSQPTSLNRDEQDQATSSTGAWLTCSFINHDCIGNATRSFIGDMMIVRATKDIKRGDEILMRYKNHEEDIAKFQQNMEQSWKFQCSCAYCAAEAKLPTADRARRSTLIREAEAFQKAHKIIAQNPPTAYHIAKAEQLYLKIEKLYPDTIFGDLPRHGLIDLGLWICMAHVLGAQAKVQKAASAILRDLGFKISIKKRKVVIERSNCQLDLAGIHAGMYLAISYYRQGQQDIGAQVEKFARGMYETIHGSMLGFEEKFGGGP